VVITPRKIPREKCKNFLSFRTKRKGMEKRMYEINHG
jgi:hypothetical protein